VITLCQDCGALLGTANIGIHLAGRASALLLFDYWRLYSVILL